MSLRMIQALWNSMRVTLRAFWRAAKQLFHEATGALFALFAADGAIGIWRQWRHHPAWWLVSFAAVYAVMMAVFAFSSFRRARRIR